MNIVIVGGGTAGWLAALMISKVHKDIHKVSLIESSSIGTIGVGESSTGYLRGIVNNETWNYGCNELDFIVHTNATPKLGIHYKNWKHDGGSYLEPIDTPLGNDSLMSDPVLTFCVANDIPIHFASINGKLLNRNISSFYTENRKIIGSKNHGYTFDAKLAADYFKNICKEDVKRIEGKINNIYFKNNGFVDYLLLENNEKIYGDFFIDASGMNKIFLKKLNVKWKSYDELCLNSALPFLLDYKNISDINLFSTSVAMNYGWMWMNPKTDKLACGYIYDNNFIDEEEAKKEVETLLNKKIEPIKNIKFSAGSIDSFWNKNVLTIGLASSFLEPLEATSIHGTIAQLHSFVFTHLKEDLNTTINESSIKIYNNNVSKMTENFKDFILMHYANNKNNTGFWKKMNYNVNNNCFVKSLIDIGKNRLLNMSDIDFVLGYAAPEIFNWPIVGLNHFDKNAAKKEMKLIEKTNVVFSKEKEAQNYINSKNWISKDYFLNILENIGRENK